MGTDRPFRPLPLLTNPHVQTVLANLVTWTRDGHPAVLRTVALPDGDALAIHDTLPPAWHPGQPIAVLVHGLGGCHRSGYMRRIANRLALAGMRVVRVDLRAAGSGLKMARKFYNAACSQDVRVVIEGLHAEAPQSPLLLLGFSLGGNIVLRLAGEAATEPVAGLVGVAAVAPPIDLVKSSEMIGRLPFYDRFYVRQLVAQVALHARHFVDLPVVSFPRKATLRDFDEIYTAPRWGYAGALDYYGRASTVGLIPEIRVPCLILTARDDPFIALDPFLALRPGPTLAVEIADQGGHMGFLGLDGQGGLRWAESRVVVWVLRQVADCQMARRTS